MLEKTFSTHNSALIFMHALGHLWGIAKTFEAHNLFGILYVVEGETVITNGQPVLTNRTFVVS